MSLSVANLHRFFLLLCARRVEVPRERMLLPSLREPFLVLHPEPLGLIRLAGEHAVDPIHESGDGEPLREGAGDLAPNVCPSLNLSDCLTTFWRALEGSFSDISMQASKPNFATRYSLEICEQDLSDSHSFAPL